jgi:hypothetical protein
VTISTTAATIDAPATIVDQPIVSFRKMVPRITATTGLTNAYVATTEIRTFLSSHAYAENATSEPTRTRYANAITGFVENDDAWMSFASPPISPAAARKTPAASICIDADSSGLLGSGAPRA